MDSDQHIRRSCAGCGRESLGSRSTCLYCGAALPPSAADALDGLAEGEPLPPPPESTLRGLTLACPRCEGVEMISGDLFGLTIHRCPVCRGLMLDANTFDHLVQCQAHLALEGKPTDVPPPSEMSVQRGEPETHVAYIACPVCQRQMARRNYAECSGVIIDRCGEHGVWLDDSELPQLLAFIATGGHALASEIERQLLERQKKQQRQREQARREEASRYPPMGHAEL